MWTCLCLLVAACLAMDHRELRHAGNAAMNNKDYALALDYFDKAVAAKPTDFNAHYFRATALIELKRTQDALSSLAECLQLKSDYVTARVKRAQLFMQLNRLDEAEADLQAALQKKPKHKLAHSVLARLQKGKAASASADILKDADNMPCAELVPKLSSAIAGLASNAKAAEPLRMRRAECSYLTKDFSQILDDTRRILNSSPKNVRALELRGHALFSLGEDEIASQHFNKCAVLDPDNRLCRWHFKRAKKLHKSMKTAKENSEQRQWVSLLSAVNKAGEAANDAPDEQTKKDIEHAHSKVEPTLRDALGNIGGYTGPHRKELVLFQCSALAYTGGNEEKALLVCKLASELETESADPLLSRADVLRRLKRYEEAIHEYTMAQQREPRNRRANHGRHETEREKKIANRKDYYKILGVDKNDNLKTIKRAYRKLAATYHPDKAASGQKEEAEKKYYELSEAFEILTDAAKRKLYDEGSDYEDIIKQKQHEDAQKHQQQGHNPFGNMGGGGRGFRFQWG